MNERFENDLACYLHYDDAPRRPARARRRKRARKHCARRFFARCCGVLCLCAGVVLVVASPLLNGAVGVLFHASILSLPKLAVGVLLTLGLAVLSFGAGMLAIVKTDVASVLKAGEKV